MTQFKFNSETENLIRAALEEDLRSGDITSEAIFGGQEEATATMTAKEEGIVCGIPVVQKVFEIVNSGISFHSHVKDGDKVKRPDVLISVTGSVRSLLAAERTALNFLQRMSGVATVAGKYREIGDKYGVKILDTRKTIPGFRYLDKYAVKTGGCENHRIGLYDMYLIKDNHIKAAGSITAAVDDCKKHRARKNLSSKIEVEVSDFDQLAEALRNNVEVIMLDNFSVENVRKAVSIVNKACKIEISGGININTINDYAAAGADFISVGALTHSVKALDISMNIEF